MTRPSINERPVPAPDRSPQPSQSRPAIPRTVLGRRSLVGALALLGVLALILLARAWGAWTITLDPLWTSSDQRDQVQSMMFSPDGTTIAAGNYDGSIALWSVADGALRRTLPGNGQSVRSIAWSPDGQSIAVGGSSRMVALWQIADGRMRWLGRMTGADVSSVAWQPDGAAFAAGDSTGRVTLWHATDGTTQQTLPPQPSAVTSLAWQPDGRQLAIGTEEGTIVLWDMPGGTVVRTLAGLSQGVGSLAWSPDGQQLAAGGYDQRLISTWTTVGRVKLWQASDGRQLHNVKVDSYGVYSIAWSPDGAALIAGGYDPAVHLIRAANGTLRSIPASSPHVIDSVAWSPDGQHVATSHQRAIKLWRVQR